MKKTLLILIMLLVVTMTCMAEGSYDDTGDTAKDEMQQTEDNHTRLVGNQPPPQLEFSLERENLIKRLLLMNDENRIGYVYIMSFGKPVGFFVIKGKVSSVNSLLTNPAQYFDDPNGGLDVGSITMPSPDFDGSYGANPDGIFFFTTDGDMIETSEEYIYSTRPIKLDIPEL